MGTQTSINNTVTNDFSVVYASSGGTVLSTISNTSNTASSNARQLVQVAGTSANDALTSWSISGSTVWSCGLDQSDSSRWKLSRSATLGTNDCMAVDTSNNVVFITGTGGMTVNVPAAGSTAGIAVLNTSNTASSQAYVTINTAGTSAGNAILQLSNTVDSVFSISHASATNSPLIFSGGNPGTNNSLTIDVTGAVTNPLQPSFSAYVSSTVSNQTGDGTQYAIVPNAEIFDQGSWFNTGTGLATAPKTGYYTFETSMLLTNLGAGHTQGDFSVYVNGATPTTLVDCNPGVARTVSGGDSNNFTMQGSLLLALTAGDTVGLRVTVSASTKTVGIFGGNQYSFFMGTLNN